MRMAKNTLRDLVWCEVVARRDDAEAFTKQDIVAAVESSARTVHDVLQTAVEHGLLEKERERQTVDDPRGDRATQSQEVSVYRLAENHEPSDVATENPENGPTKTMFKFKCPACGMPFDLPERPGSYTCDCGEVFEPTPR